jgi:hypothetical protein
MCVFSDGSLRHREPLPFQGNGLRLGLTVAPGDVCLYEICPIPGLRRIAPFFDITTGRLADWAGSINSRAGLPSRSKLSPHGRFADIGNGHIALMMIVLLPVPSHDQLHVQMHIVPVIPGVLTHVPVLQIAGTGCQY